MPAAGMAADSPSRALCGGRQSTANADGVVVNAIFNLIPKCILL